MAALNLSKMNQEEVIQAVIDNGGAGITKCIQCNACASVCPVAKAGFPLYGRLLFRKLQTGHYEEIIEDPSSWACQACNRCTEICPRDARPFDIVFAFRRMQANELAISTSAFTPLMNLHATGHAVYSESSKELREQVGLPALPVTSISDEKAQKEIQTLLDSGPMGELGIF
ncbi:4Fe-4S dicluster domain-containing protein [Desulfopila inferna]|uniref:4Fe-4S dicluster domain-containing protein n=1 Tax=Desulfopila inferna TaxID=468528 RepID=UPI001F06543E|nr:4Fe-4S dicluster domain-containing protein [Desulfopila inferna]